MTTCDYIQLDFEYLASSSLKTCTKSLFSRSYKNDPVKHTFQSEAQVHSH